MKIEQALRYAETLPHQPCCMSEYASNHCSCTRGELIDILDGMLNEI